MTRLEPEIERLAAAGFGRSFYIPCWPVVILLELGMRRRLLRAAPVRSRLRVRLVPREEASNAWWLPEACWRLPDLDLLRFGDITPADLHPLVSASLFPGRAALGTDGPTGPSPSATVRVRCRGEWHAMRSADGRLQIPHTADEERRERGLRALGGPVAGCFAVKQAWTSGTGRLPRDLRYQHREFFSRVQHGDTPGVLALLEAGVDPRIRDGRQRTLLHLLPLLEHRRLLPMLLRAGLDLEARDHHERTPLHVAVGEGPADLVHVLFDAGARIDVADHNHMALPDLIVWEGRMKELGFLKDAVERAYPELAAKQQMSRRDLFK